MVTWRRAVSERAVNGKHLPHHLAEFCFRFNRRFNLEDMLSRLFVIDVVRSYLPAMALRGCRVYKDQAIYTRSR